MNDRTTVLFALFAFAAIAAPRGATACGCVGWKPIAETAKRSDAVLVGRIVRVSPLEDLGPYNTPMGAPYLDIVVLESVKGPAKGRTIRVWDRHFGTDCGSGFGHHSQGEVVALALLKNTAERVKTQTLNIGLDDYLAGGPCAETLRLVRSSDEGRAVLVPVKKPTRSSK